MNRWGKTALALATALTIAAGPATKRAAHNIMSHHPVNETLTSILRDWKTFLFTKGEYTGLTPQPCGLPEDADMNAMYIGTQDIPFQQSEHTPTALTDAEDMTFYDPGCAVRWKHPQNFVLWLNPPEIEAILEMKEGDAVKISQRGGAHSGRRWHPNHEKNPRFDVYGVYTDILTSNYTLSVGKDERGHYLSFYDAWDFEPGAGGFYHIPRTKVDEWATTVLPKIGTPVRLYKRFYFEAYGITEHDLRETL